MVDLLDGEHFAHVHFAGRIADHAGAAADERDGAMTRALHMRHRHDRDKVSDVKAVRGRVKAHIKRDGALLHARAKLLLVHDLPNEPAFFQNVQNVCHEPCPPWILTSAYTPILYCIIPQMTCNVNLRPARTVILQNISSEFARHCRIFVFRGKRGVDRACR